jgi:NADPH:quinone reductase-like Zn-dependent oxidoreductase
MRCSYGPPEVLRLAEVERPTPRRNQICIRIFATAMTVSDCLVRGLKLPRRYRILARLVVGLTAPRRPTPGHPIDYSAQMLPAKA